MVHTSKGTIAIGTIIGKLRCLSVHRTNCSLILIDHRLFSPDLLVFIESRYAIPPVPETELSIVTDISALYSYNKIQIGLMQDRSLIIAQRMCGGHQLMTSNVGSMCEH